VSRHGPSRYDLLIDEAVALAFRGRCPDCGAEDSLEWDGDPYRPEYACTVCGCVNDAGTIAKTTTEVCA